MARATTCELNGQVIEVGEALRLRDQARAHGQPLPHFRCEECGEPVKPHRESDHGAAHMEHRSRNPNCTRSDPTR
jgi:hypothetical protein